MTDERDVVKNRLTEAGLAEGVDYNFVDMPDFGPEAWRLVDMVENPTDSVFVDGHGFYESMAIQFRKSLERAYEKGARQWASSAES